MKIQISYDSKCTGSKELRMDNIKNVFQYIQDKKRTPIGDYAFAYDSAGKCKEPIFDGYLAGIALFSSETFNRHFTYIPIQYNDSVRPSKMESGLSTNYLDGSLSREQLPIDYATSKHVFLLGPMSQHAVDYVRNIQGDVIFHVQGEASGGRRRLDRKTTTYPDAMTEHNTIFPTSFNLWTGEECSRQIRSMMDAAFTVKCNPTIELDLVEVLNNTGMMAPLTVSIPSIYVQLRTYMVEECLLGKKINIDFKPIVIDAIFQDMIDKDNSVSCFMLLNHTFTIPYLSLIGRRVYKAEPATFKEYSFTFQEGKNGDIHFPAVSQSSQVFDHEETLLNHKIKVEKFHHLLSGLEYYHDETMDIPDGLGEVSLSERAPFYESFLVKI
jgi:hypothetical protein